MGVLTSFTFDGVSSSPYWDSIADGYERPATTMHALDGTEHHFAANYTEGNYPSWSGVLPGSKYSSLRAKLDSKTQGTLVSTHGSCTAMLVRCTRSDRPGGLAGDHLLDVQLTFQRLSAWS